MLPQKELKEALHQTGSEHTSVPQNQISSFYQALAFHKPLSRQGIMTLTGQYGKISRLSYRSSSLVVVQIHERAARCSSFLILHAFFLNSVCEILAKPYTVGDIVTATSPEPVFVF